MARSAEPISVPKNQYKIPTTATTMTTPIIPAASEFFIPADSIKPEKIVGDFNNGILLFPIIRRLIDHKEI